MTKTRITIIVALIGAAGLIAAAAVGAILQPQWWWWRSADAKTLTIAGTVVDETSNRGIGQASISFAGRSENSLTEDNGNFHIELRSAIPPNGTVRIKVTKDGYLPADKTTTETDTLIIPLRRR